MKILIITNHSYMLYRFRRELIGALQKDHKVVLSMPFVGHKEDFRAMGLRCIHTEVDRWGINPKTDLKLMATYRKLLKAERPDMVITYSIKPNIYAILLCGITGIPFCGNAREFIDCRILPRQKVMVLPGTGINLDRYPLIRYPENDRIRFLCLDRIMKEKGIDELFAAMRRLHGELGDKVVLDLVGFFDDDYETQVHQLVEDGIAVFHGFQTEPTAFYAEADFVVLTNYHEVLSNVLWKPQPSAVLSLPAISTAARRL